MKKSSKTAVFLSLALGLGLLTGCGAQSDRISTEAAERRETKNAADVTEEQTREEEKQETKPTEQVPVSNAETEETAGSSKAEIEDFYAAERQEAKEAVSRLLARKSVKTFTVAESLAYYGDNYYFRLNGWKAEHTQYYGDEQRLRYGVEAAYVEIHDISSGMLSPIEGEKAYRIRRNQQSIGNVLCTTEEGTLLEGDVEPYTNTEVFMYGIPEEDRVEYFWIVEILDGDHVMFFYLNKEVYTRGEAMILIDPSQTRQGVYQGSTEDRGERLLPFGVDFTGWTDKGAVFKDGIWEKEYALLYVPVYRIPLYAERDMAFAKGFLEPDDVCHLMATDRKEWIRVRTEKGKEGWIRIRGTEGLGYEVYLEKGLELVLLAFSFIRDGAGEEYMWGMYMLDVTGDEQIAGLLGDQDMRIIPYTDVDELKNDLTRLDLWDDFKDEVQFRKDTGILYQYDKYLHLYLVRMPGNYVFLDTIYDSVNDRVVQMMFYQGTGEEHVYAVIGSNGSYDVASMNRLLVFVDEQKQLALQKKDTVPAYVNGIALNRVDIVKNNLKQATDPVFRIISVNGMTWYGNSYRVENRSTLLSESYSGNQKYQELFGGVNTYDITLAPCQNVAPLAEGENNFGFEGTGHVYEYRDRVIVEYIENGELNLFWGRPLYQTSIAREILQVQEAGEIKLTGKGLDNPVLDYHYRDKSAEEIIKMLLTGYAIVKGSETSGYQNVQYHEPLAVAEGLGLTICEPVDAGHEDAHIATITIEDVGGRREYYFRILFE